MLPPLASPFECYRQFPAGAPCFPQPRNQSVRTILLRGFLRGVGCAALLLGGYVARAAQDAVPVEVLRAPEIKILMEFKRAAPKGWKMVRCETTNDRGAVTATYQEREP